ncbi:glycosylphosphatidylinositol anchor biosynthesis [Aspergillus tubingensis]|uniref:putative glycosylphosphatidylinositol-alpha 1,2 mannosyltransferase n=1 Tax=Aspergillus tubingensis TaxID=5068 RepID=UPI001579AF5E|nr:mannosyltransferase [Aspergillus tubingensis]GFN13104.1 mannosyltransferase [Aspergillus tubingensis]GLA75472.1 glycosylphosphatidylinositol anchor biosynthesis [Aspergillus tubingensis]
MSGVRRRRRASSSTASSFSSPSSLSDSDYIADADVSDPDASLLYDSSSRSGHLRPSSSLSSSFFPSLSSLSSSSAFLLSTPPSSLRIFLFLVAFRLVNAWTVRTFFQPDEFFQSLEPAWRAAFGDDHAPWITWEWRHQLRSSLHPLLFTAVYATTDLLARLLHISPAWQAECLVVAPKVAQAVIAAVGDLYTWRLACRVYDPMSHEAWAALALTIVSPWQWFCSTRTLSNCLETSLTITALYLWPWVWSLDPSTTTQPKRSPSRSLKPRPDEVQSDTAVLSRLRRCLVLAAVACILRPTNVLIWMVLASLLLYRSTPLRRATLVREALLCGSAVLAVSTTADRFFYGFWTFPPLRFLYFNLAQSLAVFYGKNDWHYYLSQGLPLLLTTALPFAVVGLYHSVTRPRSGELSELQASMQVQLASVCLIMIIGLSQISHKEVRFIYPLLPSLHVLTAPALVNFFRPAVTAGSQRHTPRRLTLVFLLLANAVIALYTTVIHASGPAAVLSYLRDQRQIHGSNDMTDTSQPGITAGFLMPCHSTPWRSHMVYPTISAWALSCEPPVGLDASEKATYLDEADQFYADPEQFLRTNMVGGLRRFPRRPSYDKYNWKSSQLPTQYQSKTPHEWPDYLIFFAQLEPTLQSLLRFSAYKECHRTWNTAWHDDWRRRGDIVVWCVDPSEQAARDSVYIQRQRESRDLHFDRIVQAFTKPTHKQRLTQFWKSIFSSQSQSSWSWSWPWQRRKRTTIFGFELPAWPFSKSSRKSSSWSFPAWEELNRRMNDRANWA